MLSMGAWRMVQLLFASDAWRLSPHLAILKSSRNKRG